MQLDVTLIHVIFCGRKKFNDGYVRNTQDYKNKLNKRSKGLFSIIGEYKGHNDPITIKCNNCGHEKVIMKSGQFLYGCNSCPSCKMNSDNYDKLNDENIVNTYDEEKFIDDKDNEGYINFYNRFNKNYGDKFSLLSIKDKQQPVTIKCNKCNKTFDFSYLYINRGRLKSCPCCNPNRFNKESYQRKLDETFKGLFTIYIRL